MSWQKASWEPFYKTDAFYHSSRILKQCSGKEGANRYSLLEEWPMSSWGKIPKQRYGELSLSTWGLVNWIHLSSPVLKHSHTHKKTLAGQFTAHLHWAHNLPAVRNPCPGTNPCYSLHSDSANFHLFSIICALKKKKKAFDFCNLCNQHVTRKQGH